MNLTENNETKLESNLPDVNPELVSSKNKKNRILDGSILINVENVSKVYTKKTLHGAEKFYANDNVSLIIKRGERVGIIGANGAGKTTLVEMIAGLKTITSGEINYNFLGMREGKSPKECIGLQFQNNLYPEGIKVKNILDYFINVFGLERTKIYGEYVKVFQLSTLLNKYANNLSGGQKQRLNALTSIMHHPELIILDEISTGLDIFARHEITSFISQTLDKFHLTLIAISHNMPEIEQLCNRVVTIHKGKILFDEPLSKIIKENGSLQTYVDKYFDKYGSEIEIGAE